MALVRSQAHLDLSQSRWRLLLQSPTLINRICAANNEEEENAEGNCQLIPGLPDEIASECLVRAPLASHHAMTRVCTQWRDVLQTPKFYSDRARRHLADTWICALVRSNGYRNTVRAFDARSKVWISLPPMPANRHRNAVGQEIAAVGGKIVVCGGWRERPLDDVSIFDPVSHRWFAGPSMLSPRAHFVSGVVGDRLYVAGGGDGKQPRSTAAEFFDPEKNQWFPVPSLDAGISFCLGVAMAGKLFVQARGGVPSETLVLLPDLCMWSALRSNMLAWPHRPHAVVEDQILYRADVNEGKHELMRYDNQSDEWRSVGIIARGPKRRISDIVGVDGQIWAVAEDFSVGLIQVETTESDRPRVKFVNYAAASESSERLICCRVLVR